MIQLNTVKGHNYSLYPQHVFLTMLHTHTSADVCVRAHTHTHTHTHTHSRSQSNWDTYIPHRYTKSVQEYPPEGGVSTHALQKDFPCLMNDRVAMHSCLVLPQLKQDWHFPSSSSDITFWAIILGWYSHVLYIIKWLIMHVTILNTLTQQPLHEASQDTASSYTTKLKTSATYKPDHFQYLVSSNVCNYM